jgi:S-DNA-T family DNA segregation ATPase FtsK/SpoIIIE
MLFLPPDAPKPRRVQGTFISDGEIEELVRFWGAQKGPPVPEIDLSDPQSEEGEFGSDQLDAMFERAVQMAASNRQLSTSLLQRRLRIGYPRAARLREQLESEGIISPSGEVIIS